MHCLPSRPNLPLPSCFSPLPLHLLAGTVDIGHLPHPVLMHLRAFFDLLDSFTVQAVQSGQPLISDHLMFEVSRCHSVCLPVYLGIAAAVSALSSCFALTCRRRNLFF